MDQRIMLVVLGVAALAFAGLAFAAGGQGWNASGLQAGSWNGTIKGHGMMRGFDGNGTQSQNRTVRMEEMKQFEQAVLSDDYSTAKNLSREYGFGGPMLEKLNETTFAKFSQIANLESQLRQELGMNATGMMPPMIGGPGFGNRPGMKSGRGMMEPEFAKGMRKGINQNTNQTAQQ